MKSKLLFLFMITSFMVSAQDYYLELQEIIHQSAESYAEPISFRADANGGEMKFKVVYYNSVGRCPETFRFTWKFDQNIQIIPGENGVAKDILFEMNSERLDGNCGPVNPWRNPTASPNSDNGGWSRIINSEAYSHKKYVATIGTNIDPAHLYFRPENSPHRKSGRYTGKFTIRQFDNYDGLYAYLFFDIAGGSNRDNMEHEGLNYEVVYLFQIKKGTAPAVMSSNPCEIEQPDCSCCPGTVPMWNFVAKKGECNCPEGLKWDKMEGKCK
jgi:hypothetical protein